MRRFALAALLAVSIVGAVHAADEDGPLAKAARGVYQGVEINLVGQLSTALGMTQDKQSFPMRQKLIRMPNDGVIRTFNVSQERGRTDIVIFYGTRDGGAFYLTSVGGALEKAIHVTRTTIEELPTSVAKADFENEKTWWLERLASP